MAARVDRRARGLLLACAIAALVGLLAWPGPGGDDSPPAGRAPSPPAAGPALSSPALEGVGRDVAPRRETPAAPAPARGEDAAPPPAGVPLRVMAFDVHTGEAVGGTWSPEGMPRVVRSAGWPPRVEEETRRAEEHRQEFEASFVPLGEASPRLLAPLAAGVHLVAVRPRAGWVVMPRATWLSAALAAGAREAVARVPVAREALLEVCLVGPDGAPAEGATLPTVLLEGEDLPVSLEESGPGCWRVAGIPHLPGASVTAHVSWSAGGDAAVPREPPLRTVVPARVEEAWRVTVRLAGPVSAPPRDEVDAGFGDGAEPTPAVPEGPTGRVRLTALDVHGQANPRARISGWIVFGRDVDAEGRVLIEGVEVGRWEFSAFAPGHLPVWGEVDVVAGQEAVLVLREPVGARLIVSVVDPEGRLRPGARLWLSAPCFDVVDGVQRLDFAAGEDGRRSFERVRPGPCRVRASWGGPRGEDEVTLLDGETARVELRLR